MNRDIQRCWQQHVPWAWHAVLPRPLGVSFFQLKSHLSFLLSETIGGVSLPLSVVLLFLDYYSYLSLVVRIPLLLYLGKLYIIINCKVIYWIIKLNLNSMLTNLKTILNSLLSVSSFFKSGIQPRKFHYICI